MNRMRIFLCNRRSCSFFIYLGLQLLAISLWAHQPASGDSAALIREKLELGYTYFNGKEALAPDYKKAYKAFRSICMQAPEALNAMGVMRKEGLGIRQNDTIALKLFRSAALKGHPKAMYNAGVMYKEGKGIEQNFEIAANYFRLAAQNGNPRGHYGIGYLYYKGFGVEQSYENAVSHFISGYRLRCTSCTYFLSICFKEGFGVEPDQERAMRLLSEAADRGNSLAEQTLLTEEEAAVGLRSSIVKDRPTLESKIRAVSYNKNPSLAFFEGDWVGKSYLLDWSGKKVFAEYPLKLRIVCSNQQLFGEWIQEDENITSAIEGEFQDSVVVFRNSNLLKPSDNEWLEMKQAQFKYEYKDGKDLLLGNVSLYSNVQQEPFRPNTILLERISEDTNRLEEGILGHSFSISPNPFSRICMISYHLKEEQDLSVYIYSSSGQLVYSESVNTAEKTGTIQLNRLQGLPEGNYILKVRGNKDRLLYATVMIKKG